MNINVMKRFRHPLAATLSKRLASSAVQEDKKTCLFKFHTSRQARMESFAGYKMPIVYKGQSIKSEHLGTRKAATTFDVSHMMQTIIRGDDRERFMESITVADVQNLATNKCVLSVITNEQGGIVDDCIIGRRPDHIHLVSNAGNAETIWSWLNDRKNGFKVELERLVDHGLIALQGPKAAVTLQSLVDIDLSKVDFMNTRDVSIAGIGPCQVTRCGYTGEDGFELSIVADKAESLMEKLCSMDDITPAGLGARDTLRLEAGLCLHGHDIDLLTTPVEAVLSWTIAKRRRTEGGFPGSDIILKQLKEGPKIKRTGLEACGNGPPAREGSIVTSCENGRELGKVTSGTYSPSLSKNIAMAYLPSDISSKYGTKLMCEVRGKKYEYLITKMPFIKCNYYFQSKNSLSSGDV